MKIRNKVYARYKLNTRKQQPGESLSQFVQDLKVLARKCQFSATTVEQNLNNYLVDALIGGLASSQIRQRLLEKEEDLTFDAAFAIARSLDLTAAQVNLKESMMYKN